MERTRRRGTELEDALLEAAWDVLLEQGYPGFTYEAVAARAGTSRPVLYRRWPRREDLLLATIRRSLLATRVELPDTGRLRDDAIGLMRNAEAGRSQMVMLLSGQLMGYFRDTGTSFSELRDQLRSAETATGFERIVARAVERGELADRPRPPRLVNLPFDLLRHEMFMTLKPIPEQTITEIVDQIWLPLL
ncbi:TetR/AcrR family transcriptional regulator [Paractinoplanes ferrugineus]|uniref:TetR family transcriptional regulator n=1 Tax=Paractinoplanes ferrugineus TaxID=113564 RepID=A0A919MHK9_9ACTN|nr:TetR/AcrR family transcriptional regulator [Actinoplanes ferrugineus]GIE15064.1 TetR family transcriptional regulator [Actinoplanes ferrugineus]